MRKNPAVWIRILAAIGGLVFGCGAAAGVPGAVFEHGDIQAETPGKPILVRSGLLQFEIAPGIVASAREGTAFQISEKPAVEGTLELTVMEGSLRIVQSAPEQFVVIGPGQYVVTTSDRLQVRLREPMSAEPEVSQRSIPGYRPGLNVVDGIVLRQNETLRINTKTFVQSIFRLFAK